MEIETLIESNVLYNHVQQIADDLRNEFELQRDLFSDLYSWFYHYISTKSDIYTNLRMEFVACTWTGTIYMNANTFFKPSDLI